MIIDGSGTLVSPNPNTNYKTDWAKAQFPSKYKKLPHIDTLKHYQFITFRTHESIDNYVNKITKENITNNKRQYLVDKYLDNSRKGGYLQGVILKYLYDFLISKDKILYELVSFVVMSNHIHILIKPLNKLSIVMQGIKGVSAIEINKILNKKR